MYVSLYVSLYLALYLKVCTGPVMLRFRKSITGHHFQTIRKLAKMISNTTARLLIMYSKSLFKKNVFFHHVRNFTLIYGSYKYLIDVLFGPILMGNFVCFFKCLLNFRAHALQSELNKVGYTNFVKLRLQSMSFKIERAFEKRKKPCCCLHFANFIFRILFLYFLFNVFFNISYPKSSLNSCDEYKVDFPDVIFNFSKISFGLLQPNS